MGTWLPIYTPGVDHHPQLPLSYKVVKEIFDQLIPQALEIELFAQLSEDDIGCFDPGIQMADA